jgi:7-carboxy-7-deazaguanine synthase
MVGTILVSEIFGPTLQGEGALIGRPTVFVRTGACDYRCSWCDTLYAVLPEYKGEWQPMTAETILSQVVRLSGGHPILVTISGGNPALQPLEPLLRQGHDRGYTFALETQGSVARDWFALLDYLILSPKPPSSQMTTDWERLAECVKAARRGDNAPSTFLKIVIFDEADYQYAREAHRRFAGLPTYLQIGTPVAPAATAPCDEKEPRQDIVAAAEWLLRRVTADGWNEVAILPQLHVLLWGRKRGV